MHILHGRPWGPLDTVICGAEERPSEPPVSCRGGTSLQLYSEQGRGAVRPLSAQDAGLFSLRSAHT